MIRSWDPRGSTSAVEYARTFVLRLDSAAVALRNIFNNATGQTVSGARDPTFLVNREKLRWRRCRSMKEDIQTFADNITAVLGGLPPGQLHDAWAGFNQKFDDVLHVLEDCETVAYMIDSPDRYQPWQQNYESSAQRFYTTWYTRLRAMHEQDRTVVRYLNPQLPAERRVTQFPPLPANPPTLGGVR